VSDALIINGVLEIPSEIDGIPVKKLYLPTKTKSAIFSDVINRCTNPFFTPVPIFTFLNDFAETNLAINRLLFREFNPLHGSSPY
jgi:hypothetical protein